jgi:ribonuclease BN (tRNA processing enzyme)
MTNYHYATDTSITEETFTKGGKVKLLLHDCWTINPVEDDGHSSLNELLNKYSQTAINQIGLIHINPNWDENIFTQVSNMIKSENMFIAEDNMIINL